MNKILKIALAATVLIGTAGATANAASVGFNVGDVSLGFSDGYWDNSHHWHRWANHGDAERFRHDHASNYHEWRHDDKHHHM